MTETWRPAASLPLLHGQAKLMQQLRAHFVETAALEVVTPALSAAGVTDPHIDSFVTKAATTSATPAGDGSVTQPDPVPGSVYYLHTSPEFPMKRLLCAGSGDIYQICKVFRQGESGSRHNPEFLMLEWYRCGWDHHRLIEEVVAILGQLLEQWRGFVPAVHRYAYLDLIEQYTGVQWQQLQTETIATALAARGIDCPLHADDPLDSWLDLFISAVVCAAFPADELVVLCDYPASQAALAKTLTDTHGRQVSARFEVFLGPLELANGYHELTDADELQRRFERDNQQRRALQKVAMPMDTRLLQAMQHGMPECAGVAMGLDRLLMVLTGADNINEVLAFPVARA